MDPKWTQNGPRIPQGIQAPREIVERNRIKQRIPKNPEIKKTKPRKKKKKEKEIQIATSPDRVLTARRKNAKERLIIKRMWRMCRNGRRGG